MENQAINMVAWIKDNSYKINNDHIRTHAEHILLQDEHVVEYNNKLKDEVAFTIGTNLNNKTGSR